MKYKDSSEKNAISENSSRTQICLCYLYVRVWQKGSLIRLVSYKLYLLSSWPLLRPFYCTLIRSIIYFSYFILILYHVSLRSKSDQVHLWKPRINLHKCTYKCTYVVCNINLHFVNASASTRHTVDREPWIDTKSWIWFSNAVYPDAWDFARASRFPEFGTLIASLEFVSALQSRVM